MPRLKPAAPESICALLVQAVSGSDEQRYLHRLTCVLLVSRGRSCDEVAHWFGISARSVERWAHAYAELGCKGLKDHHAGGRPALLSPDVMRRLDEEISSAPSALGYLEPTWTGVLVARHLATHFGVHLSIRHCQRMLRANERRIASAPAGPGP